MKLNFIFSAQGFAALLAGTLLFSCSKPVARVQVVVPPPLHATKSLPYVPAYMPPVFLPLQQMLTKQSIGSQYYKIAIPPVIDKTDKADAYKEPLADMFYTALFETKRFTLMDRGEFLEMEKLSLNKVLSSNMAAPEPQKPDTSKNNPALQQQNGGAGQQGNGQQGNQSGAKPLNPAAEGQKIKMDAYKNMQAQKQGQIDNLVLKADGILLIYITSIRDISGTREKGISLDYRLVSTRVDEATGVSSQVLFAGSGEVNAVLGENGNVQIERNGVDKIADYIRDRFPNPDNTNYKIIAKRDNMITVNAGKKNNITTGMTGYVINAEKTSEGTQRISFRALFEVREVFNDSFNALLLNDVEEDNIIIPTIKINEQIKMK